MYDFVNCVINFDKHDITCVCREHPLLFSKHKYICELIFWNLSIEAEDDLYSRGQWKRLAKYYASGEMHIKMNFKLIKFCVYVLKRKYITHIK